MNRAQGRNTLTVMQVLPALNSGGVERGTLDLARHLVAQGHRSIVISHGGKLVTQLEQDGSTHISMPVQSKNPLRMLLNAWHIAQLAKQYHVDILHVRSRAPAWSCLWASKWSTATLVSTFHGVYGHRHALKRWYNSSMLRAQAVIAVSEYVAEHIKQVYPDYGARVHCIPRGIDCAYFAPHTTENLKQNPKTFQILMPGRITRIKGHVTVLQALARLDFPFLCSIVGDAEHHSRYLNELQQLGTTLGLTQHLRFLPGTQQMPEYYAQSDLVISATSKPESFGRTIAEALAMQVPVVATNHGGAREILSPVLAEGLFEPNDAVDCARAITQAWQRAQGISTKNFRSHILAHYNIGRMCQATEALYQQLLDRQ